MIRPLSADQAADMLEVVEDRAGLRSTVFTSQLPLNMWHAAIGEPTLADALLDRALADLQRIELQGDSMRRTGPSAQRRDQTGSRPATAGTANVPSAYDPSLGEEGEKKG